MPGAHVEVALAGDEQAVERGDGQPLPGGIPRRDGQHRRRRAGVLDDGRRAQPGDPVPAGALELRPAPVVGQVAVGQRHQRRPVGALGAGHQVRDAPDGETPLPVAGAARRHGPRQEGDLVVQAAQFAVEAHHVVIPVKRGALQVTQFQDVAVPLEQVDHHLPPRQSFDLGPGRRRRLALRRLREGGAVGQQRQGRPGVDDVVAGPGVDGNQFAGHVPDEFDVLGVVVAVQAAPVRPEALVLPIDDQRVLRIGAHIGVMQRERRLPAGQVGVAPP